MAVFHSVGDRVSQPQYGHGTVSAVNEYHTRIDFDEHGPRTFMTSRVKLESSNIPAPVKVKAVRRAKAKPVAKQVASPA